MKNRIRTPGTSARLYQSAIALAWFVTLTAIGCAPQEPEDQVEFPGPYLLIDRVEIVDQTCAVTLIRDGSAWRVDGTPFLVDERAAERLETSFRRRWVPIETRAVAHTAQALWLADNQGVALGVWPSNSSHVWVRLGREETEEEARWVLPGGGEAAGLVREATGLSADVMTWRSERVCELRAHEAQTISINGRLVATRENGEWCAPGLEPYRVEQLARRLAGLDGTPIPSAAPSGSPLIEFDLEGSSGSCAIDVYAGSNGGFLLAIDGTVGFLIEAHDARALLDAERSLGPRERVEHIPDSLTEVSIRGVGTSRVLVRGADGRWTSTPEIGESAWDCDRYVRAVSRLGAAHDARELMVTFTLPRRTVWIATGDSRTRVDFVWREPDGAIYARVDRGTPFRVEPASDRVLRGLSCVDPG